MRIRLRKIVHAIAAIGPAVLVLLRVKKGTVASDAVDVAKKVDETLPPEK